MIFLSLLQGVYLVRAVLADFVCMTWEMWLQLEYQLFEKQSPIEEDNQYTLGYKRFLAC